MTAPFRLFRRTGLCTAIAVTAVLGGPSVVSASVSVSSTDASATHSYLHIVSAQTRAEVKGLHVGIVAIEAFAKTLQVKCPGVLASEPKLSPDEKPSSSAVMIAEEELSASTGVAEQTEYKRRRAFVRAVSPLRWSDRALTRLVHSYALGELAQAKLYTPDLCADVRAWVNSGYKSVSPGTESYLRRVAALSKRTSGVKEVIMRKLKRYESPADKRVAKQTAKLEESAEHTLLPKILSALGKVGQALDDAPAVPAH
jgi:hypothetical protein